MGIRLLKADITLLDADAIVNAANEALSVGGGVCGAIHRAAGSELLDECIQLGGCETGQAKITHGYELPAKYVIHTVGPVWHGGNSNEPELLTNCYKNSLQLALNNNIKSIAFPAISCGIFGYPIDKACAIAVSTIQDFLEKHDNIEVILVCFDDKIKNEYDKLLKYESK